MSEQLQKLEWRVDTHEKEIALLRDTTQQLETNLESINRTLIQIRGVSIGIGLFYCASTVGFGDILRALSG